MTELTFETLLVREFLASPQLMDEFEVAETIGSDLVNSPVSSEAVEAVTELLSKNWRKKPVSLRRRMFHLLEGLKSDDDKYDRCCQSAICQAITGDTEQAETCLLEAADIDDERSYHHHIYSLVHGLRGERDKALFELHLSLERGPEEGTVGRILQTQKHCAELSASI